MNKEISNFFTTIVYVSAGIPSRVLVWQDHARVIKDITYKGKGFASISANKSRKARGLAGLKGQLISKGLFKVFICTKNEQK